MKDAETHYRTLELLPAPGMDGLLVDRGDLTRTVHVVQAHPGVGASAIVTDAIQSITLQSAFVLDSNQHSPPVLRTKDGWRFSQGDDDLVVVERGETERYLVPLDNIAGMSSPRAAATPSQPVPQSDEAPDHSATKQLAEQASTRARGRPSRK